MDQVSKSSSILFNHWAVACESIMNIDSLSNIWQQTYISLNFPMEIDTLSIFNKYPITLNEQKIIICKVFTLNHFMNKLHPVCKDEIIVSCLFQNLIDNKELSADFTIYMLRALGLNAPSCSRIKSMLTENKDNLTHDNIIFHDLNKVHFGLPDNNCEIISYQDESLLESYLEEIENNTFYKIKLFETIFKNQAVINLSKGLECIQKIR